MIRRRAARVAARILARRRRAVYRRDVLAALSELHELESRGPLPYGTPAYWRRVELVRWLETDDAGVPR